MSSPYIAEIRIFSFNFPPKGWAFCNGQIMAINQNQALFSLVGTFYGGNGTTTFALPNLQGRVPMHQGTGFTIGQVGGEASHTLVTTEIPAHTHPVTASSAAPTVGTPAGNLWAAGNAAYNSGTNTSLAPGAIVAVGGQPHENMSPYLTLSFCIALQGIFPSRN